MPKKRRKHPFIWTLFKLFLVVGFLVTSLVIIWITTFETPDLEAFEERKVLQSTKLYDRTGEILLYEFTSEDIQRTIIPYEKVSRHIKNASIAIEDAEFYEHNGIKPTAILRAIFANITSLEFGQGGSTITQQVVKNSILTPEKKISRKLKEWVLAIRLEQVLSKEKILELYLNEVPYGGSIYGVGEATQRFFGLDASDVTLAQAAYIAAIPQAPTFYSPYGNNKDRLDSRKNLVLEKMLENSFITKEDYEQALNEEVSFEPRPTLGIRAPHFVFYIGEYLENKYGTKVLEEGGLKVITTIDYTLQEKAEEIVKKYALANEENFNAENASLVAIDPQTGQILVMVGSRDYFDEEIDGNFNVALTHRQPGSAFKPFVYATAFLKGYTPETVVFNLETEFSTECTPEGDPIGANAVCYKPQNYDLKFTGPMTLRDALAQSVNIPAIKTLYLAGLRSSLRTAKDMGISSLTNVDQYGLTLVLGGGEVSPLEIASAYGVFANDGVRNPYTGILSVTNNSGDLLEKFESNPYQAIDENVARLVSDVLSDNVARTPAFGANSPLNFNSRDVAAKTGTTNDYRDAWTVGYTPNLAVSSWAGNNDNSSMEKKVAGFIITPLWREFMDFALTQIPDVKFNKPKTVEDEDLPPQLRGIWKGGITYTVDSISGKLATEFTPEETKEERVVVDPHTILYWIDKDNPRSSNKVNPENYPQFRLWEHAVQEWIKNTGLQIEDESVIPTEYDDIHTQSSLPILNTTPIKTSYSKGEVVNFTVSSVGKNPLSYVEVFLNNKYIGKVSKSPFTFSFNPVSFSTQNQNTLKIVGVDSVFNKSELINSFSIN